MIGWQEVLLEAVADELTVGYVGPMASEYVPSGIPFLRSLNIEPLRVNKNDLKFITPEFHKRISKSRLSPGDVVIVRTGKPGTCTIIPEWLPEANCSDLVIVRCGKRINNRFLAYYVNTAASSHVAAHLVGAVQQHFNVGSARTLKMNLPTINEQLAIVDVLSALDNKIEMNQRMNATLEGIAQALFKSWFVDFDPVKAKAEGRKPDGMDDATAALFPSSLTDSPLGPIPEGWEVKGLDEIATFLNGLALQKYPALDTENYFPVIKISQLRSGSVAGADKASTDVPPDYIITDGDILFSWSGSLEVEIWCGGNGALNQHLFKVSSRDFPKWFYFLWTRQHLDNFQKIAEGKATTMGHIQRKHLSEAKVICPPIRVIQEVNEIMETLLEKSVQVKLENRILTNLRDLLLPRLISGELRVDEISEVVEAVAS